MTNIFVGNLPFNASEDEVRALFAEYGTVHRVNLITHRDTGRPRGFGFVEMDNDGANSAIEALNGMEFRGRSLEVNIARDKRDQQQQQRGGPPRREMREGRREREY